MTKLSDPLGQAFIEFFKEQGVKFVDMETGEEVFGEEGAVREFTLHDFAKPDMGDEAERVFNGCLEKSNQDQNEVLQKAKEMEENEEAAED